MPFFPFYKFKCPACGNPVEFHCRLAGKQDACPACKKKIKIPQPENADGKRTWGNWSKAIVLGTWTMIILLFIGWILSFMLRGG